MTSLLLVALFALAQAAPSVDLDVPFERHVLENGLTVLIHEDHSDPVVAVYVLYHVGSGREAPGRTGFAHLFEHLMFQGSANVGDDLHFKLVSEAGGTLNGTTNRDRTNYFETLPAHELELALWLEADRMGFLLPAITQEKLDNQREVVKNERRQNYDNRPYGQASMRITAALYPPEHPYSWMTIGSHEDLSAASLEDVSAFFRRWYGPNNATLAIGGDVDSAQALELARKWFGSIPRGPAVERPQPRPVSLEQDLRLVMEDKVKQPELRLVWPGVHAGHPDEAALDMLASVLGANKAAVLEKALSVDRTLATSVSVSHSGGELAGEFSITLRPAPGVTLTALEAATRELLAGLAARGVDGEQLQRLKARTEAQVVARYETVARRTSALAESSVLRGDPLAFVDDLRRRLDVTPAQVGSALAKYLHGRPAVIMSVVPEGGLDQAASGATPDQLAREAALDRSLRPEPLPATGFRSPRVWHATLPNGVPVAGIRHDEVPLVTLAVSIPGGQLREGLDTLGLSEVTADLMDEGTASLDAVGLAEALDGLGASLTVSSGEDEVTVSIRALTRHLPAAVALMGDVLLEPRLDAADFERIVTRRSTQLATRGDSIRTVASNVWRRLLRDDGTPAGWPAEGTPASLAGLTLDDVRAFHRGALSCAGSRVTVVGPLDGAAVTALLADLVARWPAGPVLPLALGDGPLAEERGPRIWLVDQPGAEQSEIRVGHAGLSAVDPDEFAFSALNYVLGGAFSSRINMNLREDKGYTYGARSGNSGGRHDGVFAASSAVRTDVTAPAVAEMIRELSAIRAGVTEAETEFARDALLSAMGRQYESMASLLGVVDAVSRYGFPDDHLEQRQEFLRRMTRSDLDALAQRHVRPDELAVLVVGDATLVGESLAALGYGEPQRLDIDGNPIDLEP